MKGDLGRPTEMGVCDLLPGNRADSNYRFARRAGQRAG